MMQFKIVDLYNTKYFYTTYKVDLVYLFNTCLRLKNDVNYKYNVGNEKLGEVYDAVKSGAVVQFDLAGAKLTSDIVPKIREYSELGIEFVDTKDKWRDVILRTNRERLSIDTSEYIELPEYNPNTSVKDYIVSLDKNVTYKLPLNDNSVYIPLVVMILMSRPSIKINLNAHGKELFNYVGSRLTLADINKYTEFYLTTPEGIQVVDFSYGDTYVQRLGLCSREKALTVGSLVPTVFGKEQLVKNEDWRHIFRDCLNIMNRYKSTRKKTIEEVLS